MTVSPTKAERLAAAKIRLSEAYRDVETAQYAVTRAIDELGYAQQLLRDAEKRFIAIEAEP